MKIGTMRAEESRVFDQFAGYHSFHMEETQEPYGSFEVFWQDAEHDRETGETIDAGWYWFACFPGCLPDGDATGPFATSRQAMQDADEWHPEFDE